MQPVDGLLSDERRKIRAKLRDHTHNEEATRRLQEKTCNKTPQAEQTRVAPKTLHDKKFEPDSVKRDRQADGSASQMETQSERFSQTLLELQQLTPPTAGDVDIEIVADSKSNTATIAAAQSIKTRTPAQQPFNLSHSERTLDCNSPIEQPRGGKQSASFSMLDENAPLKSRYSLLYVHRRSQSRAGMKSRQLSIMRSSTAGRDASAS